MSIQKRIKEKYQHESHEAANQVGIPRGGEWNGQRDAFRHAYTSAIFSRDYGQTMAEKAGDRVEQTGQNSEAEHWMDYTNNSIGRDIGKWAVENNKSDHEIAVEIKKRIENGEVIVSPYDPRRTFKKHGDWERAKQESVLAIEKDYQRVLEEIGQQGLAIEEINVLFQQWEEQRQKEVNNQERIRENIQNLPRSSIIPDPIGPFKDSNPTSLPHTSEGPSNINGPVFVHPYARRTGEVKAHTRSRPDDDFGNNLGKSHTTNKGKELVAPGPGEKRTPGALY